MGGGTEGYPPAERRIRWGDTCSVPHCHELTGHASCHGYGALCPCPVSQSHLGGTDCFTPLVLPHHPYLPCPILPGAGRLRNALSALPPFPCTCPPGSGRLRNTLSALPPFPLHLPPRLWPAPKHAERPAALPPAPARPHGWAWPLARLPDSLLPGACEAIRWRPLRY